MCSAKRKRKNEILIEVGLYKCMYLSKLTSKICVALYINFTSKEETMANTEH